jgi:hypothetical protein
MSHHPSTSWVIRRIERDARRDAIWRWARVVIWFAVAIGATVVLVTL